LQFFAQHLQAVDLCRPVAVLGSTPEFRDLLATLGFSTVYVLDKNPEVYSSLTALRASSSSELFVKGDWLDTLPSFQGEFAAILSDLTSGNIPYEQQHDFYAAISAALATDGIFIDKLLIHQDTKPEVKSLLAKFDKYPVNLLYTNYFSCELFFCSDLLNCDFTVDASAFYDILRPLCDTPTLARFLLETPHITPPGTKWYYGKSWTTLRGSYERLLEPVFDIAEEPASPYCHNLRLRVTRARRNI
jgi:hypothetical protein